jgi:CheY-like chemotaxis protein/HPt (histidine-containing phosphotransfer) domain-containing protein
MSTGTADTAQGALAMLRKARAQGSPYDIALIDTKIPGMHSTELARAITTDEEICSTRLILLNGLAAREMPDAAREAGVAAYLNKPVRRAELFQCIAGAMGAVPTEALVRAVENNEAPLGAHVLLVEDNSVNQEICAEMLLYLGCDVEVVNDGRAAVVATLNVKYDAVLMDCQMPVMDGFEAAAAIRTRESEPARAEHGRVPIIALTANAMAGDRERCVAAGMDDYLSKPFKREGLRAVLERWLTRSPQNADAGRAVEVQAEPVRQSPPTLRIVPRDAPADVSAAPRDIDQKALDNIRKLQRPGAPSILDKIIDLYFVDAPRQILTMRDALAAGDDLALKRAAHTLKSSSANLGALDLAGSCKKMEDAGAAHPGTAELLIARIELDYAQVRAALSSVRSSPDGTLQKTSS